ncbi:MAG: efflux RND transporter periplasmic adaptor subunit [Pseudomonadales bacterium]
MTTDKFKLIAPFAILALAIAATFLLINSRPEAKQQEIVRQSPLVDVLVINKSAVQIPVLAQGSAMPRTETTLMSEVSGQVVEVATNFNGGGFFNKGDVLLKIDDRNYVANVKRAKASLASARSRLATAKGQAEVAYREWKARAATTKRSKAATDLYLRKPQLEEAEANLEFAKAELQQAKIDLDDTIIRAPYDCMLRSKNVDIGQFITTGAALAGVFAIDAVEIQLPLPEYTLRFLDLPAANSNKELAGPSVLLSASVGGESQQWHGELVRTEGVFDAKTRTMMAVVRVEDPYGLMGNATHHQSPLRVGTFVSATIEGKTMDGVAAIPQGALRPGNKVWLVNEEKQLRSQDVDVLRTVGDTAYISAGLENGMRISMAAVNSLVAGTEVRIASTKTRDPSGEDAWLELSTDAPAVMTDPVNVSAVRSAIPSKNSK